MGALSRVTGITTITDEVVLDESSLCTSTTQAVQNQVEIIVAEAKQLSDPLQEYFNSQESERIEPSEQIEVTQTVISQAVTTKNTSDPIENLDSSDSSQTDIDTNTMQIAVNHEKTSATAIIEQDNKEDSIVIAAKSAVDENIVEDADAVIDTNQDTESVNQAKIVEPEETKRLASLESSIEALAIAKIQFKSSRSVFTSDSIEIIDQLGVVLKDYPSIKITIEGHTDSSGYKSKNQTLSQQRADAVKDYLIKKYIDKKRIEAIGYGQNRPLVSNDTPAGRAVNRRIEIAF